MKRMPHRRATTTKPPVERRIVSSLLPLCDDLVEHDAKRTPESLSRSQAKRTSKALNRALRLMGNSLASEGFSRRPRQVLHEVITSVLFTAGAIAEKERRGVMTTTQAKAALLRLARRRFRPSMLTWDSRIVGSELVFRPFRPDAELLVRYAFWRCAAALDVTEWRRFTLRECEVPGCGRPFVEARVHLAGGPTKRCPSCRDADRRRIKR